MYTIDEFKAEQLRDREFAIAYQSLVMAEQIGTQIAKRRHAMNMSQRDLAAMVGTGQSAISRWEAGDAAPTIPTLAKIVHALGMTVEIKLNQGG